MAKVHVQVPSGLTPRQIEGFPADCERSVKGALHIRPGTLTITEGELEHLRKHHKAIARRLHVRGVVKEQPQVAAAPPAKQEARKPEATPEPTPKPSGGKGKHGRGTEPTTDD